MNKIRRQRILRSINFNGKCNRCGSIKNITLHHKFPKSKGNQREQTNLHRSERYEAICEQCHIKEHKLASQEKEIQ